MSKEHQILQHLSEGKSQRMISGALGVSRNTVSSVAQAAKRSGRSFPELLALDEATLFQELFPEKASEPVWVMPDYEKVHRDLLRHGVTLRLLWEEYVDACREAKQPPYMYSQFCKHYADYVDRNRPTMHIQHKPGDKLMVDWAGTKLEVGFAVTEGSMAEWGNTPPIRITCLRTTAFTASGMRNVLKDGLPRSARRQEKLSINCSLLTGWRNRRIRDACPS